MFAHLIGKVDVPWCVNQVESIQLAVLRTEKQHRSTVE
jgi:hypothetical protein